MKSDEFWKKLLSNWGFELGKTRSDLCITGSPNRTQQRIVLQANSGECLVLEAVPCTKRDLREKQARILMFLSQHGVKEIYPWLATCSGSMGIIADGAFWQLRHYIHGIEIPRETYGNDGWRGIAAASLLSALTQASISQNMPDDNSGIFLLKKYIQKLLPHIHHIIPALTDDILPILKQLQEYFDIEEELPATFAHGDFHPGNIIWGSNYTINGIIDWEFCGLKTSGYDAANLLGCLGMDEPAFLTGPMAMSFIHSLHDTSVLDDKSWHYLPELMAALRFGWLREWVVQNNKEMICQELDFIWLLLDNKDLLRKKWL